MSMTRGPRPPVDLDRWSALAPAALVVAGVDERELREALAARPLAGVLVWDGERAGDRATTEAVALARAAGMLDADGSPTPAFERHLRLQVEERPEIDEVVGRLLMSDVVAAVVIDGPRSVRSLGPSTHLTVTPVELAGELTPVLSARAPNIAVVGLDDGAVSTEVLIAGPTVGDVRDLLSSRAAPVRADLVVLPRTSGRPWLDESAEADDVRVQTDAIVVALVDDGLDPDGLAAAMSDVARLRALGVALDVALTEAFARDVLVVGDVDALVRSGHQLMAGAPPPDEVAPDEAFAEPAAPDEWLPAPGAAPAAPGPPSGPTPTRGRPTRSGRRRGPVRTAAPPPDVGAEPPPVAEPPPPAAGETLRYLQGYVGRQGDNVLRVGSNQVHVFIGPEEAGGFIGQGMTNTQLGFGPETRSVRVQAVLVPLDPPGPVQTQVIDIPREGRSEEATFGWSIPAGTERARARLSLVHRNRVLQTGVLDGAVGGAPVRLTEVVVLWDDWGHVDDRSDFDLALVLNHDDDGKAGVVAHRAGSAQQILATPELEAIAGRLREQLLAAAFLPGEAKKRAETIRKILVATAVQGVSLRHQLEPALAKLAKLRKIQITTARASWFLPLELVYERQPPDPDAALCARWQAGDECGDECFPGGDEFAVVCPSAFWGMTRVIERHWVHAVDASAATFLVGKSPTAGREFLATGGAVLAASSKVVAADVKAAGMSLGAHVVLAESWKAWQAAIADPAIAADVLVVMPHTDLAADTMEISGTTLEGGRFVGSRHVTGPRDNHPVVILFGCDTAGNEDDPAGWASRFMQQHAGVVFATLTMVLNSHASALVQRLAERLLDPGPKHVSVGELVRDFRVDAVRDDFLAALAITAYGDVDWKVRGVPD